MSPDPTKAIVVRNLDCGYDQKAVLRGLNFEVREGEIFVIMGESGCGKSTLLKHLIGLNPPLAGEVVFLGRDFSRARGPERHEIQKRFGVLYQSGALWSSLTVAENVALPLIEHTALDPKILFLDEPSAGLDPPSSRELDDLIKRVRDTLGTTLVVVTHELPSIFAIADNAIMLSKESQGMVEIGRPAQMAKESPHAAVRDFLNRWPRGHAEPKALHDTN
jgi:phospholipid/cholesterol/gamma-HCH transport system ATP-binding protein